MKMLKRLLGRGFSWKCKSLMRLTRSRLDVIKRRRNATEKILKKDIADLLAIGLDINAYHKAKLLCFELNLSSCYDFVEQCCGCISEHLSVMQKQRECPEECREAVGSLVFAAARFADLPELRNLRATFTKRYGKDIMSSLESFANKVFVENLASSKTRAITMEKRLELMREIAEEFSILWDSKALEQKIGKSYLSSQGQDEKNLCCNSSLDDDDDVPSSGGRRPRGFCDQGNIFRVVGNGEETTLEGHSLNALCKGGMCSEREKIDFRGDKQDILSRGRCELTVDRYVESNGIGREKEMGRDNEYSKGGLELHEGRNHHIIMQRERAPCINLRPPPHIKPKYGGKYTTKYATPTYDDGNRALSDYFQSSYRSELRQMGPEPIDIDKTGTDGAAARLNHHDSSNGSDDDSTGNKDYSSGNNKGNVTVKSCPTGRGEDMNQELQHALIKEIMDLSDEEHRMMINRLVQHYSKKHSKLNVADVSEVQRHRPREDVAYLDREPLPPSREQVTSTNTRLPAAHATSFESKVCGHVHPMLPDYDDLAARFASLRGQPNLDRIFYK